MHEVKNLGLGSEVISNISCAGLIRSGDASKGNSAGLCVMELYLCRRLH